MSRQRIRAGVVEGSTVPCPHCAGAGHVRSTASIALHVLRVLEEALVKSSSHDVTLRTRGIVALYILNQKRAHLQELERRFGVHITVAADDSLTGAVYHTLERGELASGPRPAAGHAPLRVDSVRAQPLEDESGEDAAAEDEDEIEAEEEESQAEPRRERNARERVPPVEEGEDGAQRASRRRRRRRGRGGGQGGAEHLSPGAEQPSDDGLAFMAALEGQPAPREGRRERGGQGGRPGRGPGRWRRSAPLPDEFRDPSVLFPVDEGASETEGFVSPREAHMPAYEPGPASAEAPSPVAWPTAPETPPAAETPQPATQVEPAAPIDAIEPAPPREPTEVVITQADPAAPKKGGWWSRVRTPFGG
jgi:ribonuclease E